MRLGRARLALLAVTLVLGGCGSHHPASAPASGATSIESEGVPSTDALHVVATLKLAPANAMVATPKWLWVLGGPSGVLTQIDPATNTVVRKVRSPHPPGFGTYADGSLWIASLLDDAVMQVDGDSGRVLRVINSTHGTPFFRPVGIAAAGHDLWVVNHGDETVRSSLTRLDARTGSVTATRKLPGHHAGGPLLAAGRLWISLTTEAMVARLNPVTGRVIGTPIHVDTGTCLSGSVADDDVWYTGLNDGEAGGCRTVARRLDADTAQLSPTPYGPGKRLFAFAGLGGSVWSTDIGRTVYRVDVDSGAIRPALTLDGAAASNRLIAAFGSLWVLGGASGQLARIDVTPPN